jgi:MFS transporter, FHS family, glucose/mannose:H+ symporter
VTPVASSRVRTATLVAWLCAVLAVLGAVVASVGPLLPELAGITQAPVSRVGLLISALFGGTLIAQTLSAALLERFGTRAVVAGSLAACALGTAGLATAPNLVALLASGGIVGVGYGFGSIGVNLVASRLLASRPGLILNLCNACYGVGAVAGPLAAGMLLRSSGQARGVFLYGSALLVALLSLVFLLPAGGHDGPAAASPHAQGALPRRPLLMLAVFLALGGGVEAGVSGWLATYAEATLALNPADAAVMTSQYWAWYLGGRCLVTAASLRMRPEPLLLWSVGGLVAGALALAASVAHATGTTAAIALLGAFTGPVYPLVFAVLTRQFAGQAARAAATIASAGSVGATVLPWALGLALTGWGGRGLSLATVALTVGMAFALYANRVGAPGGRAA